MIRSLCELAFFDLLARRGKAMLTIASIAIAVGGFVTLDSLVRGFERALTNTVSGTGTNLNIVERDSIDFLSSLVPEELAERVATVPGVSAASPVLIRVVSLAPSANVPVLGWADGAYLWQTVDVVEGRLPQAAKIPEVAIGADLARKMGWKVGGPVQIFGASALIVGIIQTQSQLNRAALFARLPDLQKLIFRVGQATSINVKLQPSSPAAMESAAREVTRRAEGFTTIDSETLARDNVVLTLTRALSRSVSLVALALTFFGLLSNLWSSVRERRHEFAILRAVGWPIRRIGALILCQSWIMCLLGTVLGLMIGYVSAQLIGRMPVVSTFIEPEISLLVVMGIVATTMITSALSVALPVWSVLRIDPAETLRGP